MNIQINPSEESIKEHSGKVTYDASKLTIGEKIKESQKTESASVLTDISGKKDGNSGNLNYSPADLTDEDTAKAAQVLKDSSQSLAVLDGRDYQGIEQEEGSLEDKTKEQTARAAEHAKERREWNEKNREENRELRKELEESLALRQAVGFLSQKSTEQLKAELSAAGIPPTQENFNQVITALDMSFSALAMTDQTKAYVIKNNLAPTVDNLYQGKYAAAGQLKEKYEDDFSDYLPQIKRVLADCGRENDTGLENAKWLFFHELPVNEKTLAQAETLDKMARTATAESVLYRIAYALALGVPAKDALLDDTPFVQAQEAMDTVSRISDDAIVYAVDLAQKQGDRAIEKAVFNLQTLTRAQEAVAGKENGQNRVMTQFADSMTPAEIAQVTVKRQLAEICQKMTVPSAVLMQQKGICLDTEPLENIIQDLREQENAYYRSQVKDSDAVTPEELTLLQESLGKTEDIATSHAALLGGSVRQNALLTLNELHAAIGSQAANRREWNGVFETVRTQVRSDLGDSIKKAFDHVPELLRDIDREDTEGNERAVRILGYNGMEITKENVDEVKFFDEKVNDIIEAMKPSVVLSLIRRGQNPLNLPLDDLKQELDQIQQETDVSDSERYSRFLRQLERNDAITASEREGYIGVYRLLHQIQASDGAVIGAVLASGRQMTLGNLLTQARIHRGGNLNLTVEEESGVSTEKGYLNSITDQIEEGFRPAPKAENRADAVQARTTENPADIEQAQALENQAEVRQRREKEYVQSLAKKAWATLTPEKLRQMTGGRLSDVRDISLEKFCDSLGQTKENASEQEFFDKQAQMLRQAFASGGEAEKFLADAGIADTAQNRMAFQARFGRQYSVCKDAFERRGVLTPKQQFEWDEVIDSLQDLGESFADFDRLCEREEKFMDQILMNSYEPVDINGEDLDALSAFGRGIRFAAALRQSHSYEIPIRTGDTVTALNLTFVRDSAESGRIQIGMADDDFGNILLDFRLVGSQVKGLVLCDKRLGFESLRLADAALQKKIQEAGYSIKDLSYGMDFGRKNEWPNGSVTDQGKDVGALYALAKLLVRSLTGTIADGTAERTGGTE